jgi:PucR C-terminal helix-turn-helix domain/GGDEF-like domain
MAESETAAERSFERACAVLAGRMRRRFAEIEASLATLVEASSDPREAENPLYSDYLASLPANRVAILDHVCEVIEDEERATTVPATVITAARVAARAGVPLDAILRRYSAGNAFIVDILVEEAEEAGISAADLRRLLHRSATLFDHLLEAVSEAYTKEIEGRPAGGDERRRRQIKALLGGRQPSGRLELGYDLDAHHVGLVAKGAGARKLVGELAARLDRRLLAERLDEGAVWTCWLGGSDLLRTADALRALETLSTGAAVVALGEPAEGLTGWRLSHRQANAAMPIAERRGLAAVRYADVAVLASVLRDDLGVTSLRRLYIEPLEAGRDGGKASMETLRTYFATERNLSSTAAALGVDRRTVRNRLRAVENLFERPLNEVAGDLETALQLVD